MKSNMSIKICEDNKAFLDKFVGNMITMGIEVDRHISYDEIISQIRKYFKLNNASYVEACKVRKNV